MAVDAVKCPGGGLVLVADDDPSILPLVESVMADDPLDFEGAGNGEETRDRLEREPMPDLLVLDVMMPKMGGIELLGWLAERPRFRHMPVVLLTGRQGSERVAEGLEGGATDYVVKPFELTELRARLRSALRLRRLFVDLERLQVEAVRNERLKVLLETAGAVAHAVSQPLTAALLRVERMASEGGEDALFVHKALERVARAVGRVRYIATYETISYVNDTRILDLEKDP